MNSSISLYVNNKITDDHHEEWDFLVLFSSGGYNPINVKKSAFSEGINELNHVYYKNLSVLSLAGGLGVYVLDALTCIVAVVVTP